jgi:cyclase
MLACRIIACLDVRGGRVVKGTRFADLRDVGDPVALAARYEADDVDEICFLDISATHEERATLWDSVRRTAERLFVPLTVGGGIRSADDVAAALRAGADKVGINSAAVERPGIIEAAAERFGRQCVVASVDARRRPRVAGGTADAPRWEVVTRGGRTPTGLDAVAWAAECARRGAGEILLTSIDRDGARSGYDLDLVRAVVAAVDVPVVASGGAGRAEHVVEVLVTGGAHAALLAGILHDGRTTVADLKARLATAGVPVRRTA